MIHVREEDGTDRKDRECSVRAGDVVHDSRRTGRLVVLVVSLLITQRDLEDDEGA